ncbi:probable disease resistance protein At5g66900 [Abrus precatorius]|uniref:Probable disease resistance protein At5g66900 n=1 Tax=Abrus precatorius TaxID=3816 RepID=A0A8B8KY76_ABRPR|nr:probable disease resistance protein At5g66900 [Abrus precatorius]XP_027347380.1 probable disease resistance protein At5g66900 [Abrus precatorius]
MAAVADAVIGKLVDELLSSVLEMKERAKKFRPTLELLEKTLKRLEKLVKQIDEFNRQLDRPAEETQKLVDQMKNGKELVLKCNQVQWWNCCYQANYQEELEALDEDIKRFFSLDMQAQIQRDGLETLVAVRELREEIRIVVPRRLELRGLCSPPEPPLFTVGLDDPLMDLKFKLLREQVSVSVLTVTGPGGSGKSTLAKMFCSDQKVKGKFKENIFFITFGKTPKWITIVQRLFKHNGYDVPEFQSDEDAINQLEHLLKEIGKSPILLVLDDVWPESVSLVDNFVFQIPNYIILVTSRFAIARFGPPYTLKPLDDVHAINLFRHEASLNQSSSEIPDYVINEIVKGCSGSPLALRVSGRTLSHQKPAVWHNRAKKLATGQSILDTNNDVLTSLQKSFDVLDPKVTECFRDLSLFPEAQRIAAAALVDMWSLRDEDDASSMDKINELANQNMADILVTRNVEGGTIEYNNHYVTQHGLLRDLAILQTSQEPTEKRNRLIIDISGNNLPSWWTKQNEHHIAARILSISTDEAFASEWCNLQPTEVEVLVLNIRQKKFTLPMFMKKMNKLEVLIITNYDFYRADLENFELLDCLSDLKRIRLERVSIPFLSKTGVQLKNLQKFSFFMCNVNEAFKNRSVQISDVLPNLEEINIDYCDMVELPAGLSNIVSLKKISITNCHKLSALPKGIENLVNLESLRLTSCTSLVELPDSTTSLHKLKFLDISDCISLSKLPENMGKLSNLERVNCRGCSRLSDLPYSITDLGGLRDVICDEERAALWAPFKDMLSDLRLEVVQVDFNLNWLQ